MIPFRGFTKYLKSATFSKQNISGLWKQTTSAAYSKGQQTEITPEQKYYQNFIKFLKDKKSETFGYLDAVPSLILTMLCGGNLDIRSSSIPSLATEGQNVNHQQINDSMLFFSNQKSSPKQTENSNTSTGKSNAAEQNLDPEKAKALASIKVERVNNLLPIEFFKQVYAAIYVFEKEDYAVLVREDRKRNLSSLPDALCDYVSGRRQATTVEGHVRSLQIYEQQASELFENTERQILKLLNVNEKDVSNSRLSLLLNKRQELLMEMQRTILNLA